MMNQSDIVQLVLASIGLVACFLGSCVVVRLQKKDGEEKHTTKIQTEKPQTSHRKECEKSFGLYAFGFLMIVLGGGLGILKGFYFAFPLGMLSLPLLKASVYLWLAWSEELK